MELDQTFSTLLATLGLELYDLELTAGTLAVTVYREGGVDLEALTSANRLLSQWLDEHDPIPGHYTLDVSSPGLERRLRTPSHFSRAIGELVTLRERRAGTSTRRLEGVLRAVDERGVLIDDAQAGEVRVGFDDIERARTVFVWGASAKPTPSRAPATSPLTSRKG